MDNKKYQHKTRLEAREMLAWRNVKPVVKKRDKILKNIGRTVLALIVASELTFFGHNIVVPKINAKKVNESLSYYGGNERYLRKDAFDFGYVKFIPKDTQHIKVGVSDSFTEEQKKQFSYFYNYLNSVFEVINPKYKFELQNVQGLSDCDIYIDFASFSGDERFVAAQTNNNYSYFDTHRINKNTIYFNNDIELTNAQLRVFLAHEMLHALTGASDVKYDSSLPVSVFEYASANAMVQDLNFYQYLDDTEKNLKIYNEFITYMPYDLSALMSIYGNIKDENNKQNCIKLLNDTLNVCTEVFGEMKYFDEGYTLPETNSPATADDMTK